MSSASHTLGQKINFLFILIILPSILVALAINQHYRLQNFFQDQEKNFSLLEESVQENKILPIEGFRKRVTPRHTNSRYGRSAINSEPIEQADHSFTTIENTSTHNSLRFYLDICITIAFFSSLIALLFGLFTLLFNRMLGLIAKKSRQHCLQAFSLGVKFLPWILLASVLCFGASLFCSLSFETWYWAKNGLHLTLVIVLGIFTLSIIYSIFFQLKAVKSLFKAFRPAPLDVVGRALSEQEAPALWSYIRNLAARVGSIVPDHVVVGIDKGFFVISGDVKLLPEKKILRGNTLHVDMPYLGILDHAEFTSIIAHELGHFHGEDTEYSKHFATVYHSTVRSLAMVCNSGETDFINSQALSIGEDFLKQFAFVESHWSRVRELEADNIGAKITDKRSAATALLRYVATKERIVDMLNTAAEFPDSAPSNLVEAILEVCHDKGIDDPMQHIEMRIPHPIDTHPTIPERIANWQLTLDQFLIADATRLLPSKEQQPIYALLGENTEKICEMISADWLGIHKKNRTEFNQQLEVLVNKADGNYSFFMRYKSTLFFVIFAIIGLLVGAGFLIHLHLEDVSRFDKIANIISVDQDIRRYFILIVLGVPSLLLLWLTRILILANIRRKNAMITINPTEIMLYGLDRPIVWKDVEQVNFRIVSVNNAPSSVTVKLSLREDVNLPKKTLSWFRGGRRIKLKKQKRLVIVTLGLLIQYSFDELCQKIYDFWLANQAKQELTEWQQKNQALQQQQLSAINVDKS